MTTLSRRALCYASVCAILLAFSTPTLFAQFTSTVQGTATDESGAIVPDVVLRLTNIDTGVVVTTQSNESGLFRFPDLPPGRYQLRASKAGFQVLVQEN